MSGVGVPFGFLLSFSFSLSGFPPGARRKGSVVVGTQRAFSSRRTGAGRRGSAGALAACKPGAGHGRSGAARGRRGLGRRGFPRRRASFALFGRKSKLTNSVVFASFRIRSGPHALYRKPVSWPRAAATFFLFSARRAAFFAPPGAAAAPRVPLLHFALQKSDQRGLLSRFAPQKSDQRGLLSRFAPQKSDQRGLLSHFAPQKSDQRGLLSHFASQKSRRAATRPPGGPQIAGVEF